MCGSTPSLCRSASRSADKAADGRTRDVELSRDRVVVRRAVRGMKMAVNLPVADYLGVAVRMEPPDGRVRRRGLDRARAPRSRPLASALSRRRRRRHRGRVAVVGARARHAAVGRRGRRPPARAVRPHRALCASPLPVGGGGGVPRSGSGGRRCRCGASAGRSPATPPCIATSARSSRGISSFPTSRHAADGSAILGRRARIPQFIETCAISSERPSPPMRSETAPPSH